VCESTYAMRGRQAVFKITSSAENADLERTLAERGYERIALTSVQTASLARMSFETDAAVGISTTLSEPWFADFNRLTVTPESLQASERRLLEKIAFPHAFGTIAVDGETVAVGLAVHERSHVGLFDIVVDYHHRNQGLARRLCLGLLVWAHHEGADTAYLAVMADNAPALHLYNRLGFRELYQYWYRALDSR
jgi:N-acetylglutamate synthase